jgi:hypothetical protein
MSRGRGVFYRALDETQMGLDHAMLRSFCITRT